MWYLIKKKAQSRVCLEGFNVVTPLYSLASGQAVVACDVVPSPLYFYRPDGVQHSRLLVDFHRVLLTTMVLWNKKRSWAHKEAHKRVGGKKAVFFSTELARTCLPSVVCRLYNEKHVDCAKKHVRRMLQSERLIDCLTATHKSPPGRIVIPNKQFRNNSISHIFLIC